MTADDRVPWQVALQFVSLLRGFPHYSWTALSAHSDFVHYVNCRKKKDEYSLPHRVTFVIKMGTKLGEWEKILHLTLHCYYERRARLVSRCFEPSQPQRIGEQGWQAERGEEENVFHLPLLKESKACKQNEMRRRRSYIWRHTVNTRTEFAWPSGKTLGC